MSEEMPENANQLSAEMNQLSVVDVLRPSKPIMKYDIKDLVETESELTGEPFLLPGHDITAQIKLTVNFDRLAISIIFLNSEMKHKAVAWRVNPKFKICISQNEIFYSACFYDDFQYDHIFDYESFYQICAVSYRKHIQYRGAISRNSLTLHLFVEKIPIIPVVCLNDKGFLWKIDVSKLNLNIKIEQETVVGLSSYFSFQPEGFKMQLLLFILKDQFRGEIRFLREFEVKEEKWSVRIEVNHLTDVGRRIVPERDPTCYVTTLRNSSYVNVCSRSELSEFVINNKLFVTVSMTMLRY